MPDTLLVVFISCSYTVLTVTLTGKYYLRFANYEPEIQGCLTSPRPRPWVRILPDCILLMCHCTRNYGTLSIRMKLIPHSDCYPCIIFIEISGRFFVFSLNNRHLFSHSSRGQKCKIKVLTSLLSPQASFFGLQRVTFFPCPCMVVPPCLSAPNVSIAAVF